MDKIFKTLAAAGILSVNCLSLNAQQLPKECCDPNIVEFNREPMHASWFPYDNENSSLQQTESSKYFVSLNGDWKFFFAEDPGKCPDGFEQSDFNDSGWKNLSASRLAD